MKSSYSGHLILGNFMDPNFVYKPNEEFLISDLKQSMLRSRDDAGVQYGPTHDAILDIVIELIANVNTSTFTKEIKPFFTSLDSGEEFYYTVLYNRTLTTDNKISGYNNGFVAKGYIIAIDDIYEQAGQSLDGTLDRIQLAVKIHLTEMCFLGSKVQDNKTIRIFA